MYNVSFFINGINLVKILHSIELPFATKEGSPSIAGSYCGISVSDTKSKLEYFHGKIGSDWIDTKGKTALLACGRCGWHNGC